jgi:hypothetical protein
VVMEEQNYTSTHPLGHAWPVTVILYLYHLVGDTYSSENQLNRGDFMRMMMMMMIMTTTTIMMLIMMMMMMMMMMMVMIIIIIIIIIITWST